MGREDRLKRIDFEPRSNQVDKQELRLLLYNVRRSVFFCWHDWVYWTFGEATKLHRVCKKCYKKQQNNDIIKPSNIWRKDSHYN
jgi:hypothetical protein